MLVELLSLSPRRIGTAAVACATVGACTGLLAQAPTAGAATVRCTPTRPNGKAPPGQHRTTGSHGNGQLWTVLPAKGRFDVPATTGRPFGLQPDGTIRQKFPWWGSAKAGKRLTITGRRIDGGSRTLDVDISGGRSTTARFWATSLIFPSEGCWRVTARAGDARLRFVVTVDLADPS